jgi:hypothetical protein
MLPVGADVRRQARLIAGSAPEPATRGWREFVHPTAVITCCAGGRISLPPLWSPSPPYSDRLACDRGARAKYTALSWHRPGPPRNTRRDPAPETNLPVPSVYSRFPLV